MEDVIASKKTSRFTDKKQPIPIAISIPMKSNYFHILPELKIIIAISQEIM